MLTLLEITICAQICRSRFYSNCVYERTTTDSFTKNATGDIYYTHVREFVADRDRYL
jgi:hypothetical protein